MSGPAKKLKRWAVPIRAVLLLDDSEPLYVLAESSKSAFEAAREIVAALAKSGRLRIELETAEPLTPLQSSHEGPVTTLQAVLCPKLDDPNASSDSLEPVKPDTGPQQ